MAIRPFLHGKPPPAKITNFNDLTSWLRTFWDSYYQARHGKLDCIGELTLRANEATTVLEDKRLSSQSVVTFDPKTANAAADLYGGAMYVLTANRGNESWTITHPNNANADKSFQYSIIG